MFVVYSFAINSLLYADEEQAQKGDCRRQVQVESQRRPPLTTTRRKMADFRAENLLLFLTSHQLPRVLLSLILPRQIYKSFC